MAKERYPKIMCGLERIKLSLHTNKDVLLSVNEIAFLVNLLETTVFLLTVS